MIKRPQTNIVSNHNRYIVCFLENGEFEIRRTGTNRRVGFPYLSLRLAQFEADCMDKHDANKRAGFPF